MPKIEPAVQTFEFTIPEGNSHSYIDLSRTASMLNRRFYRQGLNWAVAGFTLKGAAAATGSITINKLPNTWMVANSWVKGFHAWNNMNKKAMEENESIRPKFYDYKIYMTPAHITFGSLDPISPDGTSYSPYNGEWEYSRYVVPDTGGAGNTDFSIYMLGQDDVVGPDYAVGLIQNYQQSRSVPQSPDPVENVDGPQSVFTSLFDEGTVQDQGVLDDLAVDNDELPYHQMEYVGTQGVQSETVCVLPAINTNAISRGSGASFPCGLVEVQGALSSAASLYVHLVPGNHRGYLCETMEAM